ncbi:hypothetical protein ACIBUY_03980 [Streptomyces sp. NPDC050085]|uniref:hypothetical protein n=1 Tax=Streptomyces sp. NPDC050085 TaxID=3365600 RepID=UPI0037A1C668
MHHCARFERLKAHYERTTPYARTDAAPSPRQRADSYYLNSHRRQMAVAMNSHIAACPECG